jgi:hypothetical protein
MPSKLIPILAGIALVFTGVLGYAVFRGEQTAKRVTKLERPTVGEACKLVARAGLDCHKPHHEGGGNSSGPPPSSPPSPPPSGGGHPGNSGGSQNGGGSPPASQPPPPANPPQANPPNTLQQVCDAANGITGQLGVTVPCP